MSHNLFTNTNGPKLKFQSEMTRGDYISLCKKISDELNKYHKNNETNNIKIVPEAITEGGMKIIGGLNNIYGDTPYISKGKLQYKTIRHHCFIKERNTQTNIEWPCITMDTYEEWENSKEVLFPVNTQSQTHLRAFHGALWTIDELLIIKLCFESFNIKCTKIAATKKYLT
jgi:hypothetical protein